MSILNVVVAPTASWFDVHYAASKYGVPCAFYRPKGESISYDFVDGSAVYVGPLRIVYTEEIDAFRRSGTLMKLEARKKFHYLVILGCSGSKYSHLQVYEGPIRSLVAAHLEYTIEDIAGEISFEEVPHHREALQQYQRDSILSRVSQLLYRVKDKTERARVANDVYRYLSGGRARVPIVPIVQLSEALRSETADKYREAGKRVRQGQDIDKVCSHFKVDRFEVGYCLRKSGADEELLQRIAFKD